MKFICFNTLEELPPSNELLFKNAEKDSMFFSKQWFENLIATALEDEHDVLFACVIDESSAERNENTLHAILPLIVRDNGEWSSLTHSYSSLFTILLAKEDQQEILNYLVQGLKELPFTYLTLEPIAEDDEKINLLQQTLESVDLPCYRNHRYYNWYHELNGQSFDEYMGNRPSRVRNTVTRKQRKLKKEFDYEIRLHIDGDVGQALADYHDIYKVSWKANEQYETIVSGLTKSFSKAAWPRLAILYVEGEPIAAHLWFVVHRKASIFRLVYNQEWKKYSPGTILMSYLLEYVIDTDKVEEIDFLTGNDSYKQDWMTERRERWNFVCFKKPRPKENVSIIRRLANRVRKQLT